MLIQFSWLHFNILLGGGGGGEGGIAECPQVWPLVQSCVV